MEKTKYFDRLILTNDGGKYSPSIRKLRQDYLKLLTSSNNSQSSIDLISSSLKCDDCQKNDGLFQCCHCNQRLCIRCCNKHYKKVTNDIDYLYNLNEQLLIKIFHIKTDLDQQKNDIIEQCQKWRIDTINTINKAHTLIIQTVHDEYEILNKEYELFVEKEISKINNDKNQLIQMKKGNLGSLISSPASTTTTTKKINSKISMDMIKQRIEKFAKHIDKKGKFSFQVKLPKFHIDDNLRVESCFGDNTRSTSALWQDEDFIPSTEFEEKITKKEYSPSDKDVDLQSDHCDSTYGTNSSSSNSSLHIYFQDSPPVSTNQFNRRHTHTFHPISSSNNHQTRGLRRRTTALPVQSSSLLHRERLSDDYPWIFYRTNSTPTFIE